MPASLELGVPQGIDPKKDVVERPFGFNQYHETGVLKKHGLDNFIKAAWDGRLLVKDGDSDEPKMPPHFPTWKKVHQIFRKAGMQL